MLLSACKCAVLNCCCFSVPAISSNIEYEIGQLKKIETPVIFILGIGEKTHKFHIQLTLRNYFLESGYKVSQVGSRNYCELFGFHSMPEFMYSYSISESSKIILFNNFIKELDILEKPDVIIIGIPGGIMPLNDVFTNKFGIMAYEISQAVTPDAAVFSIYFNNYQNEHFERLITSIRYRLGIHIDFFNMANIFFDWDRSRETKRMQYLTVESKLTDTRIKDYIDFHIPIYNILNDENSHKFSISVLNKLLEYGQRQYI